MITLKVKTVYRLQVTGYRLQVYRFTGLQVYRFTGLQVYRFTGLQVYRLQVTGYRLQVIEITKQKTPYKPINTPDPP